jgi:1,4-dihydroxy-2-naphthoate octaprenyltransferase
VSRWIVGARPRTLPAAVVPVVVGTAAAVGSGIIWWRMVAAMVVALAIQIATNYVNDYADGERGTDEGRVGPVRLVATGLATASEVKVAAGVSALVAAAAGIALAAAAGWWLVLVGLASLAAGYFYTAGPKPYGYAGLGEVFVFVFFGLVATVGSAYVHNEEITLLAVGAAVPVGFLATALLVVNNLRDIPTDARSGKRTLAVRLGDGATRALYVALVIAAFLLVPLVALRRPWALLAFLALPAAVPPLRGLSSGRSGMALIPVLGDTGRLQLVFGLLLALGLALSG